MKKLIVANWKSQKTLSQVRHWLTNFPADADSRRVLENLKIVLAPPYPFLSLAREIIDARRLPIHLAVQDLSGFGSGAYTGEVAASNLEGLDLAYAILGHSERRRFLAETDMLIADKVAEAKQASITPILCLDEPYWESQAKFLSTEQMRSVVLAYEPVAAIGSGKPGDPGDLLLVRQALAKLYGPTKLIYGGSVTAANVTSFLRVCDGVLLGGASLELSSFVDLLYQAAQD